MAGFVCVAGIVVLKTILRAVEGRYADTSIVAIVGYGISDAFMVEGFVFQGEV